MEPKEVVERRDRLGRQLGAMWTTALVVGMATVVLVSLVYWLL
jgi:hypothetical protein